MNSAEQTISVQQLLQAATVHHQAGRLTDAAGLYQEALRRQPDNAGVLHLLGLVAYQMGKFEDAAALIARAIQLEPDAMKYCNLGLAWDGQGKRALAVESYRMAIGLQPDHADSYFNLGVSLHAQGLTDEALASYRQGLARKPGDARAHAFLASMHIDLGQYASAQAEIDRALIINSDTPLAWALLASLRKMTPDDQSWLEKALSLLPKVPATLLQDAITLQHAIGKHYDDTGQYDAAFAAHSRANAARRRLEGGYACAAFTRLVDTLIATYTHDAVRRQYAEASHSERPVLIVGMPRSGTSLIEQIIASHPATFGAGELPYWGTLPIADLLTGVTGENPGALVRSAVEGYEKLLDRHSATAHRMVDKMPGNFCWLGLIMAAFPNARIIHTQRNPLDTCLSIYFQNLNSRHAYATDLHELASYYREYRRLMAHWRSVLPPERFIEVPYEALIEDQEGWSRRIIGFLGLDWDDRCLDFHKTERKVATSSNWQVRQKIYQTSKERWRHYEKHLGPLLGLLEEESGSRA